MYQLGAQVFFFSSFFTSNDFLYKLHVLYVDNGISWVVMLDVFYIANYDAPPKLRSQMHPLLAHKCDGGVLAAYHNVGTNANAARSGGDSEALLPFCI